MMLRQFVHQYIVPEKLAAPGSDRQSKAFPANFSTATVLLDEELRGPL